MKIYYKISLLLLVLYHLGISTALIFIDGKTKPTLFWQIIFMAILLNTAIALIIFIYKHFICNQKV